MLSSNSLHIGRLGFSLDVSPLSFPSTGFFLLCGENGSGKSLLLSSMAGIHADYKGDILLNGLPLRKKSRLECAQSISYLPQTAEPLPPLPAMDYLTQGLFAGGESRIPELLEHFKLRLPPEKNCGQFSGGETQILRLIRACAAFRPLVLLDEPDSFLSQKRKGLLNSLLEDFSKKALVIAVAHDERVFPKSNPIFFKEIDEIRYFLKQP